MGKDYKSMDVHDLLKESESLCRWVESAKETMEDALYSVKTAEELEALIGMHINNLKYLAYRTENNSRLFAAKEALEKSITFYVFAGMQKDGSITSMAFYDLEEAKQEARAWKEDNDGYVYITVCATTEEEVKDCLKGFPKKFLDSHPILNPWDEYALSLVSNSDMVFGEVYSEWDEEEKEF